MSTYRGTYNADGSIAEWPERDITNNTYSRPATHYRLDKSNQFVVLPPRFDAFDRVFTLLIEVEKRAAEIEASAKAADSEANREAIAEEDRARRAVLGTSAPVVERPSVSAPAMMEPEVKASRLNRGTVTNDANAE